MNYQQRFGPYALQPYGMTPVPTPPPAPSVPLPKAIGGDGSPDPASNPMGMNPFQYQPGKPNMSAAPKSWAEYMQMMQGQRDQGGARTASDMRDLASTGYADATLGNIAQSFGLGIGMMGGMGIPSTMAKYGLSELGFGTNPFGGLSGFGRLDPDLMNSINSPIPAAAQAQRARAFREQAQRNADRDKSYAEGGKNATAAHDRSRQGAGV